MLHHNKNNKNFDIIIVGAGLSGLSLALMLTEKNPDLNIAIILKNTIEQTNSFYAQGGIAANVSDNDSVQMHVNDTIIASDNTVDSKVVTEILKHSKEAISWLIGQGVKFDTDAHGDIHLTREGGHSVRRILHIADHTGKGIMEKLWQQINKSTHIHLITDQVIELLVDSNHCYGVKTIQYGDIYSEFVILATGGLGQIYQYTTNPMGATGDGVALAYSAGASISDIEFIQFHPTVLYNSGGFLISEAMRGEGAMLYNNIGERFMEQYDNRLELAPRDVVARAIYDQISNKNHTPYVMLDISHQPAEMIKKHFPSIYQKCLLLGYDLTKQSIPVVPAAHYSCGGIDTDLMANTSIKNLYAVGECANTGLHRANRLASNSLLECVVMSLQCSKDIISKTSNHADSNLNFSYSIVTNSNTINDKIVYPALELLRAKIQQLSWQHLGITRSLNGIQSFLSYLPQLFEELNNINIKDCSNVCKQYYYETKNILLVINLAANAILNRPESVGVHYIV